MSALLQVGPLNGVRAGRGVLYAEFVANPETAPYLVSSTRSVLWVERLSSHNHLRAAFRKNVTPEQLFTEVVANVIREGTRRKWGNVHPLTRKGIKTAIEHLRYYDIQEVELLQGKLKSKKLLKDLGFPCTHVPWMLPNTVVVVPTDRSFLGFFGDAGDGYSVCVVHNASRGMAVAQAPE